MQFLVFSVVFYQLVIVDCQQTSPSRDSFNIADHGRIVGGVTGSLTDWPWQVAVYTAPASTGRYSFVCGGTLIGPKRVLSAAHCFENEYVGIAFNFGVSDLRYPSQSTQRQLRYASYYINHPDYNTRTNEADISLLGFDEAVEFTDFVKPAALPTVNTTLTSGQTCVISGYGETQGTGTEYILRYAQVDIIDLDTCNDWHASLGHVVPEDHICAGYEEGGIDSCQGDSGGPLVCYTNGTYYLQGVTSYGYGCAVARQPGVYTSVMYYLDWINQNEDPRNISNKITLTYVSTITSISATTSSTDAMILLQYRLTYYCCFVTMLLGCSLIL